MLQLALPLLFFTAVSGAFFYCRVITRVIALSGETIVQGDISQFQFYIDHSPFSSETFGLTG